MNQRTKDQTDKRRNEPILLRTCCILTQSVVHVDVEAQRAIAESTITWTIGELDPLKWLTFRAIQLTGVSMDCAKR